MAGDLIIYPLLSGTPRGIDQSAEPGQNTVYDCCNIDTCNGRWETRSALVRQGGPGATGKRLIGAYEFIPDPERPTSRLYTMMFIFAGGTEGKDVYVETNQIAFYSLYTSYGVTLVGTSTPFSGMSASSSPADRCSFSEGLFKYTEGDITDYCQSVVIGGFASGDLLVYHQKDINTSYSNRVGTFEPLTCLDGGLSDVSYLTEPPKGKYVVRFKERTFVLNCSGASNRVFHTGPDSSGNFPVNVWPASYNFDVGGQEAITGACVYRDRMYIFKENGQTYVLSGDGINGNWQIDLIDYEASAVSHHSIVVTGNGFYFIGNNGIYFSNGGAAKNISHPRLQYLWDMFSVSIRAGQMPFSVHDGIKNRILFLFSLTPTGSGWECEGADSALVYDITNNAWTRWGSKMSGDSHRLNSYYAPFEYDGYIGRINYANTMRSCGIVGMPMLHMNMKYGASSYIIFTVLVCPDDHIDTDSNNQFSAPTAFMLTNPTRTDSLYKVLRSVVLTADRTGDWDLGVLGMCEGDSVLSAMTRKASAWNLIVDDLAATEHTVDGTSNFTAASNGPVDIWTLDYIVRVVDSRALVTASGSDKIKLSSTYTATGSSNPNLVVPQDAAVIKLIDMSPPSRVGMWDGSSHTYDDYIYGEDILGDLSVNVGIVGTDFQVLLTTAPLATQGASTTTVPTINPILSLRSIELHMQPKIVRRLG